MKFEPREKHPRWRGGTTVLNGYLRYKSGPHRDKLVHRVVMQNLMGEFSYYGTEIPPNFTVEHVDHNPQHNCPENLLLLQAEIHIAISWASWRKK
jgi:hypothetical protein